MPNGSTTPSGVRIEEIDMQTEQMNNAIEMFDGAIQTSLEAHGMWESLQNGWPDIMPREEVFLISLFYLNMRQAALQMVTMLQHGRELVDASQRRKGRRRLYAPRISWRKWLQTGGGEDQRAQDTGNPNSLQSTETQVSKNEEDESDGEDDFEPLTKRQGDAESGRGPIPRRIRRAKPLASVPKKALPLILRLRSKAADYVEGIQRSQELQYALKLTIACFLVLWPALVPSLNTWFSIERGCKYSEAHRSLRARPY